MDFSNFEPDEDFDPNRPPGQLTPQEEDAKQNALVAYIMMLLGVVTGIFWFIGAVWAMYKSGSARGTRFAGHYANITSTFWWGIIWSIVGLILTLFFIGYLVLLAVWIWSIWRMVKGLAKTLSNQPY